MADHVLPVRGDCCSFEAAGGSSVAPLVDGAPTFRRLDELLRRATSRLDVALSFIDVSRWRHPTTGEAFIEWMNRVQDAGVQVNVLCWRQEFRNPVLCHGPGGAGWDAWAPRDATDGVRFALRFDSSGPDHRHCHHEKTWVIDGDTSRPVAVTGGITVQPKNSAATPGHPYEEARAGQRNHDVNVEVRGRAAGDIARHFVQRWNAACGHERAGYHFPDLERAGDLPAPPAAEAHGAGACRAQVLRTVRPRQLPGRPGGEASILRQWEGAIGGARSTIYIEQQHICHPGLLRELLRACDRGVRVLYLVPSVVVEERAKSLPRWACGCLSALLSTQACSWALSCAQMLQWALLPPRAAKTLEGAHLAPASYKEAFLDLVPSLGRHKNFCLAGLHDLDPSGRVSSIYVHSKLAIVDDAFLLVGSANLVDMSMDPDHTELAVAAWGSGPARAMRDRLYAEHAGAGVPEELAGGCAPALEWLRGEAGANAASLARGRFRGRLCELDARLVGNGCFLMSMVFDLMARGAPDRPLAHRSPEA